MPFSSKHAIELSRVFWVRQVQSAKATHTDWWQTVSFSEGLEKRLNRQMDTVCYKKRVLDSISCPSQIVKGSASISESNTLRSREDSTSTDRSKIYAGQTCHRTSFLLPSKGWLLQQALSGLQEVGRMETNNQSVPTKSACNHSSFQDGNFGLCSSFFTEAQLGHFPRLDRCIFPHTNSLQVKEVSSFCTSWGKHTSFEPCHLAWPQLLTCSSEL